MTLLVERSGAATKQYLYGLGDLLTKAVSPPAVVAIGTS
jgi:hypothetical protein